VQIIHDDKDADPSGDSFRLLRLNSGCHVVAKGYLPLVADVDEDRRVIDGLQTLPITSKHAYKTHQDCQPFLIPLRRLLQLQTPETL